MPTYTYIGVNSRGEAVFSCLDSKTLSIEKDHRYLVNPTPEELKEIYEKFPQLKAQK